MTTPIAATRRSSRTVARNAEDVALARRILQRPAGVMGFVAAGDGVDAWHVLPRLAAALGRLSPGRYALLRPPAIEEAPARAGAPFRTRGLTPTLDELLLPACESVACALGPLATAIEAARVRYAHILVDVGAFLPDAPEVLELPDVLISVAAAGVTRERDLLRMVRLLPSDRHVGTLLVE
jgi:hypothetical protein